MSRRLDLFEHIDNVISDIDSALGGQAAINLKAIQHSNQRLQERVEFLLSSAAPSMEPRAVGLTGFFWEGVDVSKLVHSSVCTVEDCEWCLNIEDIRPFPDDMGLSKYIPIEDRIASSRRSANYEVWHWMCEYMGWDSMWRCAPTVYETAQGLGECLLVDNSGNSRWSPRSASRSASGTFPFREDARHTSHPQIAAQQ